MTEPTTPAQTPVIQAKKPFFAVFGVLCLAAIPLLLRAVTLGGLSIVDPTEARYATIAQYMVATGDWITPHIPVVGGSEAYLGKPPLHFWLTGLAFELFGQDEWVARLPSFICGLIAAITVCLFALRFKGMHAAALCLTFLTSAAIFFFFSGSSVVDVTLTAFTTLAVSAYVCRIFAADSRRHLFFEYLMFAAMAGAFMTKGPIGIVLTGFPAFLFCLVERNFSYLKPFFSLKPILLFALLVIPWFILSEIASPGFLKYFIINENFGRYFLKDYGDKYGVGHRHMLGSVWWMLALATLPWGILLIPAIRSLKAWNAGIWQDRHFRFFVCWAFATPIFFTFVKQLHIGYVIPALPPFALVMSYLCLGREQDLSRWIRPVLFGFLCVIPAVFLVGLFWGTSFFEVLVTLALFTGAYLSFRIFSKSKDFNLIHAGVPLAFGFATLVFAIKPFIDAKNSSHVILETINRATPAGAEFKVGIIRARNYSPWYYASAGHEEFGRAMTLVTTEPEALDPSVINIIMKGGDERLLDENFTKQYEVKARKGAWVWYARLPITIPPLLSTPETDPFGLIPTPTPTPTAEVFGDTAPSILEGITPTPTAVPDDQNSSNEDDDSSDL